jgi:hypothetical protein
MNSNSIGEIVPLDPLDPQTASDLFQAAVEYRKKYFDTDWNEAVSYDEAEGVGLSRKNTDGHSIGEYFQHVVHLATVSINNERKVGSLNANRIVADPYVEGPNSSQATEIKAALIRWGFRVSGAKEAMDDTVHDYVPLTHGVCQVLWDSQALGGKGAPTCINCDVKSIYVDPKRRDRDFNKDCGWIFEVQYYTEAELKANWPEYFKDHSPGTPNEPQDLGYTLLAGLADVEGQFYPIVRAEISVKGENGKRKVMWGILDPGNEEWIKEPKDNKTGLYSYIPVTGRLKRKHAYPKPASIKELGLSDLTDTFLSMAVNDGLVSSNPKLLYNSQDPLMKAAVESLEWKQNIPGSIFPVGDVNGIKEFSPKMPETVMNFARFMMGLTNESGEVQPVQKGVSTPGESGRAIQFKQAAAEISNEAGRSAIERAGKIIALTLLKTIEVNMDDFRMLRVDDDQNSQPLMVNVPKDHPLFPQLLKGAQSEPPQAMITARPFKIQKAKEGGPDMESKQSMPPVPVSVAQQMVANKQADAYELIANDIQYGYVEMGIRLTNETSRGERQQRAMVLSGQNKMPLEQLFRDLGFENPKAMVKALTEQDEILKMGTLLAQNPEMKQALEAISQDPFLQQMAQNPELVAHIKMLLQPKLAGAGPSPEANGGQPAGAE